MPYMSMARRSLVRALAGLICVSLVACGPSAGPEVDPGSEALQQRLTALQLRIEQLEEADRQARAQTDKVTDRLREALSRLRASADRTAGKAQEAAAATAEAAGRIEAVIRDLAVLTDRYDYHLRRYHGSG